MTRSELIERIAEKARIPRETAEAVVHVMFESPTPIRVIAVCSAMRE